MIHKGTFEIPVNGTVDLGSIRSRSCSNLYERDSNGQYCSAGSVVKLNDIPDSLPYSDHATVDVSIDENPFNRSVARCCSQIEDLGDNVDSLTQSINVGATGIAAAKAAGAFQIGKSLSSGFSKYISYMIREKMTLLKAKLPGLALTIDAAGKQLGDRLDALEGDYQRITSRYAKIMEQLGEQLENRIRELDRPAFDICKIVDSEVFTDPLGTAFGQSVCSGAEQLTTADSVKIAEVKTNALETMRKMEEQVISLRRLKMAIGDILSEHEILDRECFSMPTIRLEGDRLDAKDEGVKIFFPDDFNEKTSEQAREKIDQGFSALAPVRKSARECAEVDKFFNKHVSAWLVEHKDADPRVLNCIRSMWENTKTKMSN